MKLSWNHFYEVLWHHFN